MWTPALKSTRLPPAVSPRRAILRPESTNRQNFRRLGIGRPLLLLNRMGLRARFCSSRSITDASGVSVCVASTTQSRSADRRGNPAPRLPAYPRIPRLAAPTRRCPRGHGCRARRRRTARPPTAAPRLRESRRPGGRFAAGSVARVPAPSRGSAACSSWRTRLAPGAWAALIPEDGRRPLGSLLPVLSWESEE